MKKLALLSLVCFILASFVTLTYAQEIQGGNFSYSSSTAGYTLHKGNGDRVFTVEINFEKPFTTKPDVFVSLNSIDANKNANIRVEAKAISVSRDGFTIQIKTWSDSQINMVGGSWIAIAHTKK
ncbi:MAG: H-type lectin domain-containing protein [Bacteroidetes bacterium]|nr:H-type lectin domain-containing protein [Bacteroidota bacterium]